MPMKLEAGRWVAFGKRLGALVALVLLVLAAGCEERDRLTFPSPDDGIGPITTIEQPNASDTTVDAGPDFLVSGRTVDPDGVTTVYFLVIGGNQPGPYRPSPAADTVWFGLPVSTVGRSGETLTVEIYGVDSQGNEGAHSVRQIVVR
ncbi:MAG: hypothetical protein ACJ8BF_09910 [Gemmatimonadales bacterium]